MKYYFDLYIIYFCFTIFLILTFINVQDFSILIIKLIHHIYQLIIYYINLIFLFFLTKLKFNFTFIIKTILIITLFIYYFLIFIFTLNHIN